MNSWPLIASSLLMGVTGSLHCVAMCSSLQQTAMHRSSVIRIHAAPGLRASPDLPFQAGRIAGYTLLGVIAGLAGDWVLTGAALQPVFKSLWAALNMLLLIVGLSMLLCGRQPAWLGRLQAPSIFKQMRPPCEASAACGRNGAMAMAARGMLWALLPCGLLYSALALSILAGNPIGAGLVMAAFGLGTAAGLLFLQGALRGVMAVVRTSINPQAADTAALRVGGLLLAAMAGIALAATLTGQPNPFCT